MKLSRGYHLENVLQRSNNNFDLVRLICALLVIFGHSFIILSPENRAPASWDLAAWFGYPGVYSASVAVKIFFFLSGIFVTDSLLKKDSVPQFIVSRSLRIWPALFAVVILSAAVLGPLTTAWDLTAYAASETPYRYVVSNLLLVHADALPGVFLEHFHPRQINGSLWTLYYEVAMYTWLVVLHLAGATRRPWLLVGLLAFCCIDPLLPSPLLPTSRPYNPQIALLPACFLAGACVARWKHRLVLRWEYLGLASLALWLGRDTPAGPYLLFLSLFLLVLLFAAARPLRKLRPEADLSYGTYLWGFPSQQLVAGWIGDSGFVANFLGSILLSLTAAFLSWHLIEKRAIDWSRRWGARHPKLP